MERKAFPVAELKAIEDGEEVGVFEAIVAVFSNIDYYGDRIQPGAFSRTLKERGFPAIVWSHMWSIVPIGACMEAEEVEKGLRIKGKLFIEEHEIAKQVYAAMKYQGGDGRPPLREFSFGYDVVESASVTEDGEDIHDLKDLELYEVGPTLLGANPETQLLGVKALEDFTSAVKQKKQEANPEPNSAADEKSDQVDEEALARSVPLLFAGANDPIEGSTT